MKRTESGRQGAGASHHRRARPESADEYDQREQDFVATLPTDLRERAETGPLPAFHQAARYGDFRLLEAFLLAGWDPDCPSFSANPAEASALACAVRSRLSETGEFDVSVPFSTLCAALLHKYGANLELGCPTPLASAAMGSDTGMCRELLAWGASPLGAEGSVPVAKRAKVREVLTWVAQTTSDDDVLF